MLADQWRSAGERFRGSDRLKEIEDRRSAALKEVLDELLEEAFAVCREAGGASSTCGTSMCS